MSKTKKVMALLMSFVLIASVFAGCGNNNSESLSTEKEVSNSSATSSESSVTGNVSEEEEIPVDYFAGTELTIAFEVNANDKTVDFNDKAICKLMEEKTGIHINWILVDSGVAAEKKAVLLTGDKQPDAYISLIKQSDIVNSPDLFYDISEEGLLEKWAPNLYEEYAVEYPHVLNALTWPDGSIYSLPIISYSLDIADSVQACFPAINTEWLKKIDKEIPTNADELYEVLVAFRDNDMNGNGDTTDEIPLVFQIGSWKADPSFYMQMWGIAGAGCSLIDAGRMLKNGEVVSTYDTENFRSYLEYMHKLYDENLLAKDSFTLNSQQYAAIQSAETPVVGVSLTYNNSNFKQAEGVYQMFYFQGMEGVDPYFVGSKDGDSLTELYAFGIVPTADANIEALLHWWNYMGSTEEMKKIAAGYVEGYHYEVLEDGRIQKLSSPKEGESGYVYYDLWSSGFNNIIPPENPAKVLSTTPSFWNQERVDMCTSVVEAGFTAKGAEDWTFRIVPADKVEGKAFIEVELDSYIQGFHADAIKNGVTDASWKAHLDALKSVGYYEWLDYWKSYVANSWD